MSPVIRVTSTGSSVIIRLETLGPETAETKSPAGRRSSGLPPQLVELLHEHREEQEREWITARQM